jgi:hypothetical protein
VFGSPLFVTHAFHQILLAVVVVAAMAVRWRAGRRPAAVAGVVVVALGLGVIVGLFGAPYTRAIVDGVVWMGVPGAAALAVPAATDLQGVVSGLPLFQLALFVALVAVVWHQVSPRRTAVGAAVLVGSQLLTFLVLAVSAIDVTGSAAALALRGWAVAVPGAVVIGMLRSET